MMEVDANFWSLLGSIGSAISGFAALIALILVGRQIRQDGQNADISNVISFWKTITDLEERLTSEKPSEATFIELINFLEVQAALLNANALPRVTRKIVEDKVISALVLLENSQATKDLMDRATDSPSTFEELRQLKRTNHRKMLIEKERLNAS